MNGGGQARVIRRDKEELSALLQRADKLCPAALQNAHHGAGALLWCRFAQAFGAHIAPHQDSVAVHGGVSGILRDADFPDARFIRLHKAPAAAGDLDYAGNEIRFSRPDVAVALRSDD